MICFKYGRQGHKKEACPVEKQTKHSHTTQEDRPDPEVNARRQPHEDALYGNWMLVKKLVRRRSMRSQNPTMHRAIDWVGPNWSRHEPEPNRVSPNLETTAKWVGNLRMPPNASQSLTSEFRALAEIDLNANLENKVDEDTTRDSRENISLRDSNSNLAKDTQQENLEGEGRHTRIKSQPDKENMPKAISEGQLHDRAHTNLTYRTQ